MAAVQLLLLGCYWLALQAYLYMKVFLQKASHFFIQQNLITIFYFC